MTPTKRPSTGGGSDARMACVRTSGEVRWTTALASDADGRSFHLCAVMNSELPEVDSAHLQRFAMRLSLWVGFFMLCSKLAAYWITGSAAILSDAAESVVHVIAVSFAAY